MRNASDPGADRWGPAVAFAVPRPEPAEFDPRAAAARALRVAPAAVGLARLDGPASQARLWRAGLRGDDRAPVVVKRHRSAGPAVREARALRDVATNLPAGRAPRLVLDASHHGWLAMSWVPGETPGAGGGARGGSDLGADVDAAVGAALRRLHRGAAAPDPLDLADAWERRSRALGRELQAASAPIGAEESVHLAARLATSRAVVVAWIGAERSPRVPCHRDLAPRNLRVQRRGDRLAVGLVDFAHARADLALVDVARWCNERGGWDERAASAFWRGYGRAPDAATGAALAAVCVHDAVAAIAWGARHDDPERIALGRRAIVAVTEAAVR